MGSFRARRIDEHIRDRKITVDQKLPKPLVTCPRCGEPPEVTGKRTPEGMNVYSCKNCSIFFSQYNKKMGWCSKLNKFITPKHCLNCEFIPRPVSRTNKCQFFGGEVKDLFPEGWKRE